MSMISSGNKNFEGESNLIPKPVYTYLSGLSFLANLTPPNKQSFQVKSEFKSRNHVSNS